MIRGAVSTFRGRKTCAGLVGTEVELLPLLITKTADFEQAPQAIDVLLAYICRVISITIRTNPIA